MEKVVREHNGFRITVRSEEQGFYAYVKKLDRPSTGAGVSMGSDIIFGPYNDADTALSMATAAVDRGDVW